MRASRVSSGAPTARISRGSTSPSSACHSTPRPPIGPARASARAASARLRRCCPSRSSSTAGIFTRSPRWRSSITATCPSISQNPPKCPRPSRPTQRRSSMRGQCCWPSAVTTSSATRSSRPTSSAMAHRSRSSTSTRTRIPGRTRTKTGSITERCSGMRHARDSSTPRPRSRLACGRPTSTRWGSTSSTRPGFTATAPTRSSPKRAESWATRRPT